MPLQVRLQNLCARLASHGKGALERDLPFLTHRLSLVACIAGHRPIIERECHGHRRVVVTAAEVRLEPETLRAG